MLGALAVVFSVSGCGLHGKPRVERRSEATRSSAVAAVDAAHGAAAGGGIEENAGGSIVAPGIVEPWGGEVDLSAQEPGWIARILVNEGDTVRAGQLLAVLADDAQLGSLELARAAVAEFEAAFLGLERGATDEELRQAAAEHDAAQVRAAYAQAAAERMARLRADGTVSENEADRAAAEARAQAAAADRAAARLQEVRRGAEPEDRRAAAARLAAARARLGVAEADLARRRVAAPSGGTVLLSRFHPGEFWDPGTGPLFVLGDMTRLQVRLEVDEIDASGVRVGGVCALISDGGESLGRGTITRAAPKMGRRVLPLESPTARADVRVREVFVEIPASAPVIPGQRVWGYLVRPDLGTKK